LCGIITWLVFISISYVELPVEDIDYFEEVNALAFLSEQYQIIVAIACVINIFRLLKYA
jgi:hypothetical protein